MIWKKSIWKENILNCRNLNKKRNPASEDAGYFYAISSSGAYFGMRLRMGMRARLKGIREPIHARGLAMQVPV